MQNSTQAFCLVNLYICIYIDDLYIYIYIYIYARFYFYVLFLKSDSKLVLLVLND